MTRTTTSFEHTTKQTTTEKTTSKEDMRLEQNQHFSFIIRDHPENMMSTFSALI